MGCKADAWTTHTTWYLAGSNAGALDSRCLDHHGPRAVAAVAVAGILANLALLAAAIAVARRSASRAGALLVPALSAALAAGAEAFSYLLLNSLAPRADVALLIAATGLGGGVWFAAGALLASLAGLAAWRPLAAMEVSGTSARGGASGANEADRAREIRGASGAKKAGGVSVPSEANAASRAGTVGAGRPSRRELIFAFALLTLAIGAYRHLAAPPPAAHAPPGQLLADPP